MINYFQIIIASIMSTIIIVGLLMLFLGSVFVTLSATDLLIVLFIILLVNTIFIWSYNKIIFKHGVSKNLISKQDQELITLKASEKYRREFFGNVSHELKTPIFNIQGYVETLADGALYDENVNKKYLKRTSKSIDRLIYIIKDLESIAQLESEELHLELTEWNLKNLISEIIEQFEIKSKKKKIQLIHDERSTDFLVYADKGKMGQVLSNLISNSIKYGKHGGYIKVRCHQSKEQCLVSVKDNGIGIAEKNINRLFERFYRVDKSRSRDQGGTGLGLAIVKHIIEAHNQSINVKSKIQKGTEFVFSINCYNCK
jgi:two-component system phosphate regulon sensor histidine kinase PhoR